MTYDNIKSHKKTGLHPLPRRHFWKTTEWEGGGGGGGWVLGVQIDLLVLNLLRVLL